MLLMEMAQYLHDQALGSLGDGAGTGDIFISMLPAQPEDCLALYPKGGLQADDELGYDFPLVEVIVRGTQPQTAIERAESIYRALHGFHNGSFVAGGLWVVNCRGQQSAPEYTEMDANNRYLFRLPFQLEVQKQHQST